MTETKGRNQQGKQRRERTDDPGRRQFNLLALSWAVTVHPSGHFATTQITFSRGRGPGICVQKLPQVLLITRLG